MQYDELLRKLENSAQVKSIEEELRSGDGILRHAWVEHGGEKWFPYIAKDRKTGTRGFDFNSSGEWGGNEAVGRKKVSLATILAICATRKHARKAAVRCKTGPGSSGDGRHISAIEFDPILKSLIANIVESDTREPVSDARSDDFLSPGKTEIDALPNDGKTLEVQSDDQTGQVATYQGDPKKRAVVENYAVAKAIAFFRGKEEFSVDEKGKPYDLHCQRGDLLVHVEVKGTTGFGDKVIVTRNEIKDARNPDWRSDLFIVRNIVLTEDNGEWVASGGKEYRIENWQPHDDDLSATQFEYSVPKTT